MLPKPTKLRGSVRRYCAQVLHLLCAIAAHATISDHGDYTLDAVSGFNWLDLTIAGALNRGTDRWQRQHRNDRLPTGRLAFLNGYKEN